MDNCIFCKIIKKEIKSDIVYEDENTLIFKDLNPVAPVHLLAVPKKHISSISEADELTDKEISRLIKAVSKVAADLNLDSAGYRVVTNTGETAGQSVLHLHFHILGRRNFSWPPG